MLPRRALAALVLVLPAVAAAPAAAAPLVLDRFDERNGPGTMSVVAGEFDGDGRPDFAATTEGDNAVQIHVALDTDGDFLWRERVTLPSSGNPVGLAAADLDGDGDRDLVATDTVNDAVVPMLNSGIAQLAFKPAVPVGDTPWAVAAGDLNADGKVDLVTADRALDATAGTVSVLLGTGGGAFAPAVSYTAGQSPDAVALGDTDEDGDLDVAVVNRVSNTVMVRRNAGDGTFGAAHTRTVGTRPMGVTAADLDGDGDADLAVANSTANTVTVLRSAGDGTFGTATHYSTGESPKAVTAGDLDGDGNADLAVAGAGTVTVRPGAGDGTFGAPSYHGVGGGARGIDLAQLDADGRPDLITANEVAGNVSLLLQPVTPEMHTPPYLYSRPQRDVRQDFNIGNWRGTRAKFSWQWLRCADLYLRSCTPVGAPDTGYTATAEDSGKRLRLRVTAYNGAGSATATSAATKVIDAPSVVTPARHSGASPLSGKELWAYPADISGWDLEIAYAWLRCDAAGANCAPITGADATDDADYTPTTADSGLRLRLRTTATNWLGTVRTTTLPSKRVDAPVLTATPRITGTPQVGQSLLAGTGGWAGPPAEYTYKWLRCNSVGQACAPIGTDAASKREYVPVAADAGHRLRATVTATNQYGSASVNSFATPRIAPAS